MLSDIKNQLNQMQSMQSETMASAGRDAEAIAEVVRNEIRRAMMVRGKSGVTIRDTIDEKIAHLERDDYEDDRSGSQRCVCGCVCLGFAFPALGPLLFTMYISVSPLFHCSAPTRQQTSP